MTDAPAIPLRAMPGSATMVGMHPATKFRPPSAAPHAILRPDLLGSPDAALHPVVVVHAPAGYGKTTAVVQWLDAQDAAVARRLWVSLDEDDDDPAGLWGAIAEAAVAAGLRDAAGEAPDTVRASLIMPLLDAFADASGPTVLVLDDLHRIAREDTLASLDWFLGRIPPRLAVVLISRMLPELPSLDRLRAAGAVQDVSIDDLRLDAAQTAAVLSDARPTSVALDRVTDLTGGWPAAVVLVGAALQRGIPLERLASPRADGLAAIDALVREGLAGGDPCDDELLRRMSVFERFDASILGSVLETERAWTVAMDVAERTGLVAALDDDGRWWRLHHLVRERLHAELGRREPTLRRELHARAALAFERENDLTATIHHLFGAEDFDAIADILSNVRENAAVPRQALGLSWIDRIPAAALARDPRLAFWEAWAITSGGEQNRRDRALARGRLAAPTGPVAGFADWDDVEDFIRGQACYRDVGAALRAGERFVMRHPLDNAIAQTAAARYATMLWLDGRPADGLDVLARIEAGGPLTRPLQLFVPAYRALCLLEQGELRQAESSVTRAQAVRADLQIGNDPVYLPSELARARLRSEQGDPVTGLAIARQSLEVAGTAVDTVLIVPSLLIEVARAEALRGNRGQASVALAQAGEIIDGATDPGALPARITAVRARFGLDRAASSPREALSRRELEVLTLLPTDLSSAEIAAELFISPNTARSHIKSIHRKLEVGSRADAVAAARRAGLLAPAG